MVVDRTEMLGAGPPSSPKKPILSSILLGLGAIGCTACDQSKSIGLDVAGCVATHGDKEFDLLTNGRAKVLFRENSNLSLFMVLVFSSLCIMWMLTKCAILELPMWLSSWTHAWIEHWKCVSELSRRTA